MPSSIRQLFVHILRHCQPVHLDELWKKSKDVLSEDFLRLYRHAVRRKANLEVTGVEKPKTRLRRRKANKRLCREEKPVSLVSDEKKPVRAVPGRKMTTNVILRVKTQIKNISEITSGTNYI